MLKYNREAYHQYRTFDEDTWQNQRKHQHQDYSGKKSVHHIVAAQCQTPGAHPKVSMKKCSKNYLLFRARLNHRTTLSPNRVCSPQPQFSCNPCTLWMLRQPTPAHQPVLGLLTRTPNRRHSQGSRSTIASPATKRHRMCWPISCSKPSRIDEFVIPNPHLARPRRAEACCRTVLAIDVPCAWLE